MFGKKKNPPIPMDVVNAVFRNISEQTNWDLNQPMLWSYFFYHQEPGLLENARDILAGKGYRIVSLNLCEKQNETEPDSWGLIIQKEEVHTPKTLDKRNKEFSKLVSKLGIDSYDGMEVGPIE